MILDFEKQKYLQFGFLFIGILAVPVQNPYIFGQKPRYLLGEFLDLNCTSNSSDPVAELFWYINSESVISLFLV